MFASYETWKPTDYATILSGEYGVTIHITDLGFQNKIWAIKAVKDLTGMGLKESKDLVDSMFILHNTQKVKVAKETATKLFNEAIKTLREAGISDGTVYEIYHAVCNKFEVAA
jgi:ribosomal protein L7/L12